MTPHLVSDHAVVRWLQRVKHLGPELSQAFPAGAPDREIARHGCQLLGLTVAEAREIICPRRLHAGIQMGAAVVRGHDRTLLVRGGRIVTTLAAAAGTRSHSRPETQA